MKDFPSPQGPCCSAGSATCRAVADVSFAMRQGETFGLVGESGCGKTTLGRLIVGLEKPTSGASGSTATTSPGSPPRPAPRARDVQLMFQDSYASMDPRMRVGTILREPLVSPATAAGPTSGAGSRRCSTRSGCPRARWTATRTSSPAGSASGSGWPGRWSAAGADRGRRAGVGAGRVDPVAGPQPDAGPAGRARADVPVHLARPVGGAVPGRRDRGDVPRQAGRDRPGRGGLRRARRTRTRRGCSTPSRSPTRPRSGPRSTRASSASCPRRSTPPSGCRFRTRCPRAQELCADRGAAAAAVQQRGPPGRVPLPAPRAGAGAGGAGEAAASAEPSAP